MRRIADRYALERLLSGAIGVAVALVFAGVAVARHHAAAGAIFIVLGAVYAFINALAIRRYLRGELRPDKKLGGLG